MHTVVPFFVPPRSAISARGAGLFVALRVLSRLSIERGHEGAWLDGSEEKSADPRVSPRWIKTSSRAMLEPMLRYEEPTLAHSEADVWHALTCGVTAWGPLPPCPGFGQPMLPWPSCWRPWAITPTRHGLNPCFWRADHYLQAPDTTVDADLLRAAELSHPGVPGSDPRPSRAYRPCFVVWARSIAPAELAAIRDLTAFVSDVAGATAQPILLALQRFLVDGMAVLSPAVAHVGSVDPPVADEA